MEIEDRQDSRRRNRQHRTRRKPKKRRIAIALLIVALAICLTGVRIDNGHIFFFGMPNLSGWTSEGEDRTYLDRHGNTIVNQLYDIDADTYFFDNEGHVITGEKEIDGDLFFFDKSSGKMLRDKEQEIDGKWFYYTQEGTKFVEGWLTHKDGRKVYYKADDGQIFGEQTVDGKEYFFSISTGGMMTGTMYFQEYKYTIGDDGVIKNKEKMQICKGIDVSSHQTGKIDWKKVSGSGVQFAIVRAGYISSVGDEIFVPDEFYEKNVLEAQANGISVGSYIYLYGFTEDRIRAGLEEFDAHSKNSRLRFDLPVFLDVEDEEYLKVGSDELGGYDYRTNFVRSGLEDLAELGYRPGFYTFLRWANKEFDAHALFEEGYPIWIANWYKNDSELEPSVMAWNDEYPSMWQYRATGEVPGIPTNVDMDYLYLDIMPDSQ
ncbi:MAG: hypothetical protein LBN34_09325 [Clostridiales Family XIII bacterium]|jgi:GH25 family lysozyme M1 (1,4-beta-N-acetylmuramidase)|nr:hypothetical protein [Clostridiales Family XIII bacterium]